MKIKFLSLNIYNGGLFMPKNLKFLDNEQPDIIALQEVYNGTDESSKVSWRSIQVLSQQLTGYNHFYSAALLTLTDEGDFDQGNAIFTKFPITHQSHVHVNQEYKLFPDVPADRDWSKSPNVMQNATIDVAGTSLNIFNIHGVWGRDGNDNPARDRMGDIILEQIKDKPNVILAGDFNLRPSTQVVKRIEQQLTNVFKDELTTTFCLKHKNLVDNPGYAQSVVDMVFVSPNIQVTSHICPQVDISDHLPMIVEIEIS